MKHRNAILVGVTALVAVVTVALANSSRFLATSYAADPAVSAEEIIAAGAFNYANPDVLVDTAWVQENLDNDEVRILHIGRNRVDYIAGHLPNAIYIDRNTDLTNEEISVNGQILTAEQLDDLFSERGIANDHTIVLYDDISNLFAARAYWVLKYYQHEDVRIYNGGTIKWLEDGNRLARGGHSVGPAEYVAGDPDPEIRTTYDYVIENLNSENVVTCDTRSNAEFAGDDVRAERGGHIPGTTHLEWVHAVNEDGTFKAAPELAALFYAEGLTPDKEILTYCQTGVRSAHTWFVLTELLGYPNVRNYDGSWTEWGNNPDSPIANES